MLNKSIFNGAEDPRGKISNNLSMKITNCKQTNYLFET